MKQLRAVVEGLGHDDVRTYVRSGNVIFDASSSAPKKVGAQLEEALAAGFGSDIPVIIRTHRELEKIAGSNPFPNVDLNPVYFHVLFLKESASSTRVKTLDHDRSPPDEFQVKGREIYLSFPNGSGRSKLTLDYFEKKLGTRGTARNWRTVLKLLELMEPA
jgi:uncharacterized protein (DUF1697 family)